MAEIFQDKKYHRLFSLQECGFQPHVVPSDVFQPIFGDKLLYITSPMQVINHPTIGVYIDGACPGNGTPAAKGGIGVYFGRNSPYNLSAKVPADEPQTSQRAEVIAAIRALEQIEVVNVDERSFEVFIIVTDSQYLVKSITKDISRWKTNGWKTSAGTDVKNKDLWEFLDSRLTILSNQEYGIDVVFWQVDRSETTEANRLANLAIAA